MNSCEVLWSVASTCTFIMAQVELTFLGIVQVPLSNIRFMGGVGQRPYDEKHSSRLSKLFSSTSINHADHNHWIEGYVDHSAVQALLQKLGSTLQQLRQMNEEGSYLLLFDQVIFYTHGRHRIEAARSIHPESSWTVRLSSADLKYVHSNAKIRRHTDRYHHEKSYTDGHIYRKLRQYDTASQEYAEWYARLSEFKQAAFESINQRLSMAGAIDKLIDFPGVIDDLHLGIWHKYFVWRLEKEAIACLTRIYTCVSCVTGGSRVIQRHFDGETIRTLEGRAPATSPSDREWIHDAFKNKKAFRGVTDPQQRQEIEFRVVTVAGIFPSIRSFHANMLYLGIAAQSIWTHLIPKKIRQRARENRDSLSSVLNRCWVETPPLVEVQEGQFLPVQGAPSFDLVYNQLILAALRQFPNLVSERPKIEGATEMMFPYDPIWVALFQRRAFLFGIQNDRTEQGAAIMHPFSLNLPDNVMEVDTLDEALLLNRMDHRWGRPYCRIYSIIQRRGFLPQVYCDDSNDITVLFVLRDFLQTFLRPCVFEHHNSAPRIHINIPNPSHVRGYETLGPTIPKVILEGHNKNNVTENYLVMDINTSSDQYDVALSDEDTVMEESYEDTVMEDQFPVSYPSLQPSSRNSCQSIVVESLPLGPPLNMGQPDTHFRRDSPSRLPNPTGISFKAITGSSSHYARGSSIGDPSRDSPRMSPLSPGSSRVRSNVPTPPNTSTISCNQFNGLADQTSPMSRGFLPRSTFPTPVLQSTNQSLSSSSRSSISRHSGSKPPSSVFNWLESCSQTPWPNRFGTNALRSQFSVASTGATVSEPRSTCPTPLSLRESLQEARAMARPSGAEHDQPNSAWQGFIDSDDSMSSVSF